MFYDIDIKYNDDSHAKVFLPEIIAVEKDKLDGYKYIKTIDAGTNNGHILYGDGLYFLCMRRDDHIKVDKAIMEPIGFRRKDMADLEKLAATFVAAREKNGRIFGGGKHTRKYRQVTKPVESNAERWHIRMEGQYLINTKTGQEVHLGGTAKTDICAKLGLSVHHIDAMLSDGIEAYNWCFKGERLDGQTWEEYNKTRVDKVHQPHYKHRKDFDACTFIGPTGHTVKYTTIRKTASELGINYERFRKALLNGDKTIGQYKIIR